MAATVPPGTPAVSLPAFKASQFTTPRVALGDAVTMVRLIGAGENVPVTFGQTFVDGDLAPTDGLVGRTVDGEIAMQVDVKATHTNGSVRHAIISCVLPTLAGSRDVWLIRSQTKATAALAARSDPAGYAVKVAIDGVAYTAHPHSDRAQLWLDGAAAGETVYNSPLVAVTAGGEHPMLMAQFCIRDYPGNSRVDMTIEHSSAYRTNGYMTPKATAAAPNPAPVPAQTDIIYDVQHLVGGAVAYEQKGLRHFVGARWKKTHWTKGEPDIYVQHFTPYLIETRAFSAYDPLIKMAESELAVYAKAHAGGAFGPMQSGIFTPAMGTTGGRPEIGLLPEYYVAALMGDRRAWDLTLALADAGGTWPTHKRDHTGQLLDVLHYPNATIKGTALDSLNRRTGMAEKLPQVVSTNPCSSDVAHQPSIAYLPYLLTGDFYYLEEMHFWANYNLYDNNPAYRGYHLGWMKGQQVRGQGWGLRGQIEAAYFTPDAHSMKSAYIFQLDNSIQFFIDRYVDKKIRADGTALPATLALADQVSDLGFLTDGYAIAYSMPKSPGGVVAGPEDAAIATGIGPWQNDFVAQAVGFGANLGHPGAARLLKWISRFVVDRMTKACWIHAPIYALRVRESSTAPLYTSIRQAYARTLPPELDALPCNSPGRLLVQQRTPGLTAMTLGEMSGYPTDAQGYGANMQPALAAAVDSGIEGAEEGWKIYGGRSKKQRYDLGMQFAIVPRTSLPPVQIPTPPQPPVVVVDPPADENPVEARSISLARDEWKAVDTRGINWLRQLIRLVG